MATLDQLPAPMTPPECDLRGMEWMPLHGHKLYGSDFDAIASDSEFRAAQRLWWAAWQQQVPAASLPDDDRVLAHVAGYQRDPKGWLRVRDVALHAFIKCSDGRLYHRFLAPEAVIAWEKRIKERERKAAYRAKRDGNGGGNSAVVPHPVPRDNLGTGQSPDADKDGDVHVDNTGQDRTGQFKKEKEPPFPLSAQTTGSPDAGRRGVLEGFDQWWAIYPLKRAKGAARRAWPAAVKKSSVAELLEAVKRTKWPAESKFIPHPATWLNGERWQDEPSKPPSGAPQKSGMQPWHDYDPRYFAPHSVAEIASMPQPPVETREYQSWQGANIRGGTIAEPPPNGRWQNNTPWTLDPEWYRPAREIAA